MAETKKRQYVRGYTKKFKPKTVHVKGYYRTVPLHRKRRAHH